MPFIRDAVELGEEFAGYRIERLLGRGGFGAVYLASDLNPHLQRRVALKILNPELGEDPAFRERFLRESLLTARLDNHPSIVTVYDAGEAGGMLWLAMRFVDGIDLRTLVEQRTALDGETATRLLSQVASALDVAHEAGLVHRDVKPANILLSKDLERAYLADFGLTKQLSAHSSGLTRSGQFLGTVQYVAPEQLSGRPVDGRADGYALGCVLFECLTGRPPFEGGLDAVIAGHLSREVSDATALRSDLPPQINTVLRKAMAKNPADRYPTCGELVAAAGRAFGPGHATVHRVIHLPEAGQQAAPPPAPRSAPAPPPPGPPPPPAPSASPRAPADPGGQQEPRPVRRRSRARLVTVLVVLVGMLAVGGWAVAGFGDGESADVGTESLAGSTTTSDDAGDPAIDEVVDEPMTDEADNPPAPAAADGAPAPDPPESEAAGVAVDDVPAAEPVPIQPVGVHASSSAEPGIDASGAAVTYEPFNTLDGDPTTTWRVDGDGLGEQLTLDFDHPIRVAEVGLLPGYAKIDPFDGTDRFTQNRRVTSALITADDGTSLVALYEASPELQYVAFDAVTSSLTIEITGSTDHGGRDFTAVSEVVVLGALD